MGRTVEVMISSGLTCHTARLGASAEASWTLSACARTVDATDFDIVEPLAGLGPEFMASGRSEVSYGDPIAAEEVEKCLGARSKELRIQAPGSKGSTGTSCVAEAV